MNKIVAFDRPQSYRTARPAGRHRRRSARPAVEVLEDRWLLAASSVSAIQQYGVPSVFAIGGSGLISYNFLTLVNGQAAWNGWTQIAGGVEAKSISTGTVLVSGVVRPYVFAVTTSNDIVYNAQNSSGNWNGWTTVGSNVGATTIASGLIPIMNAPYVVMTNTAQNVYYNYQTPGGSWAGWSPVGVNVGGTQIATGVIRPSTASALYEPYVFMINGNNDVFYKIRSPNGSWGSWSAVGLNVGAASISAVTLSNRPYVSMLNGAGSMFVNFRLSNGAWAGWSPVGAGFGSGATPATAMASVTSDFSIYDLAINGPGQVNSTFGNYGTWSTWFAVGALPTGVTATSISVTSAPNTAPFAFAIGTDQNVYWIDQTSWATWSEWASLGAPT